MKNFLILLTLFFFFLTTLNLQAYSVQKTSPEPNNASPEKINSEEVLNLLIITRNEIDKKTEAEIILELENSVLVNSQLANEGKIPEKTARDINNHLNNLISNSNKKEILKTQLDLTINKAQTLINSDILIFAGILATFGLIFLGISRLTYNGTSLGIGAGLCILAAIFSVCGLTS